MSVEERLENQRIAGFKALLASRKTNSWHLEEPDGSLRRWQDLSPEGRLEYIARDAALFNVPFEEFAKAVRESVNGVAIEEAGLRLAMRNGREFYELEKMFPDEGRTEATPLVDRIGELLNAQMAEHERGALTLEEQATLFEEMRTDYAARKREDAPGNAKEAYRKLLDGKSQAPAGKEKDKGIDR